METVSPTTEVLLRDIHELFSCCACRIAPLEPPVYACRQGHAACASCRLIVHNQCRECDEPLAARNLPLEEILLAALYNESNDLIILDEKRKTEEEKLLESRRLDTVEHMGNVVAEDCYEQMLGGGRTLKCPFPCNMRVTAPGLYRHFGFQHPEVFVGMLCKNIPCSITIPYDHIAGLDDHNRTRCVFIFVVDIGDGEQKEEDKISELNSMNAAELLSITHNMRYMLKRQKYLAMLTVSRISQSEAFAVWVTALYDFSPVKYTLKYNCESNCVSYQGRPNSLHLPIDVWDGGLVLPSALVTRNLHPEGLEITVVFHLDLPFPPGCDSEKEPEAEVSNPAFRDLCDVQEVSDDSWMVPRADRRYHTLDDPVPEPPPDPRMHIGRLDIRVGKVDHAHKQTGMNRHRYLMHIDIGDGDEGGMASSELTPYYKKAAMLVGRMVVVVTNVLHWDHRDVSRRTLVMCASDETDMKLWADHVELMVPPPGSKIGDIVTVPGFKYAPDCPVVNPKSIVFETIARAMRVDGERRAVYRDVPLEVEGKGHVTADTLCSCRLTFE